MSRIFHWGAVGFDLRNKEEVYKDESGCGMGICDFCNSEVDSSTIDSTPDQRVICAKCHFNMYMHPEQNDPHYTNACVSAIAQVGGDPAIVVEMLAKLKECEVLIGDWGSHTAEAFGSSKQLDADIKAIRFLIAKAERKV